VRPRQYLQPFLLLHLQVFSRQIPRIVTELMSTALIGSVIVPLIRQALISLLSSKSAVCNVCSSCDNLFHAPVQLARFRHLSSLRALLTCVIPFLLQFPLIFHKYSLHRQALCFTEATLGTTSRVLRGCSCRSPALFFA